MHELPAARFFALLCRLVAEFDPSYLAIAIDSPRETLVRRKMYKGYKANRKEPDLATRQLFSDLWDACRQLGIAVINCPGWEADDVLGTLSELASEQVHAVVVSPDKDLGQLIGPVVHLYDPTQRKEVTLNDVRIKFGVNPDQIPDYLAIVGDRVDGIPGVKGLGHRAAVKLLSRYGSLEGLRDEGVWDGGDAAGVGRHFDNLKLFAELTIIRKDLPLRVSPKDLEFNGFRTKGARAALSKLRAFKTVQASGLAYPYP